MQANQYSDALYQAIDTIVQERLNQIKFDTTEICSIVSKDQYEKNKYMVTNNSLTFEAYALDDHTPYDIGTSVYVTIPQGQYDLRKLIIGHAQNSDSFQYQYQHPFDRLIPQNKYTVISPQIGQTLSAHAYVTNDIAHSNMVEIENVQLIPGGLGMVDYIGLDFAFHTDFGGSQGEFLIQLKLFGLNEETKEKIDLLKDKPYLQALLVFSSKQLYGNPYYLNNTLHFQHLFKLPLQYENEEFKELEKVKSIGIELITKGPFTSASEVELTNLELLVGYDIDNANCIVDKLVLDLDNTDSFEYEKIIEPNTSEEEAETISDIETDVDNPNLKVMSIDWNNVQNQIIYNEAENMQYPIANDTYVYWLQYYDSLGYKKTLESIKPILIECYENEDEQIYSQETYANNINNKFKNDYGESLEIYDKEMFDRYLSFYNSDRTIFHNTLEEKCIDLEESGAYWKTVQRIDASLPEAYIYSFIPSIAVPKEQIKVIIKDKRNTVLESNGLTFTNANQVSDIGSHLGWQDTLKLTLAPGDDGIYNNYGIDNKLLSNYNPDHIISVSYIDNTEWNNNLQKVVWKIPQSGSMITLPENPQQASLWIEGIEDNAGYYICENAPDFDAQTVSFGISSQFNHAKLNNVIVCEITRYRDETLESEIDKYQGRLNLLFGTQGTSGTDYAFNIYPVNPIATDGTQTLSDLTITQDNKIAFTAILENAKGDKIQFSPNNLQWYYLYGNKEIYTGTTGSTYIVEAANLQKQSNSRLLILMAKLTGQVDTNDNTINYIAYYPIAQGQNADYYMSGPSRIVYNFQGGTPNYDSSPYQLFERNIDTMNIVSIKVDHWDIIFEGSENDDGVTIKNGYWSNFPSIEKSEEGQYILHPLDFIQTNPLPCAIAAYDTYGNILYTHPLLMVRNTYAFQLLNTWDGEFTIDKQKNQILTKLIGAGTKNDENQYTGVLMGAVGSLDTTSSDTQAVTGLYGFQNGAMRFKLDENGEFYVGTGEDNHIQFVEQDFEIKTDSITIDVENDDKTETELYLSSDTPKQINDDKYYLYMGNGALTMNENGVIRIGGGNNAQWRFPTEQGINNTLLKAPSKWYDEGAEELEGWEQIALYLWTRTEISTGKYTYEQLINPNATVRTEYTDNLDDPKWTPTKPTNTSVIYYRKIRYIPDSTIIDVIDGPTEFIQGTDGTSPYILSLDNDYDVLVRETSESFIGGNKITIGMAIFEGSTDITSDTEETDFEITSYLDGIEVKNISSIQIESNKPYLTIEVPAENIATLSEGSITITHTPTLASKIFKFKVIDDTTDYNFMITPQTVNTSKSNQTVTIAVKDSQNNTYTLGTNWPSTLIVYKDNDNNPLTGPLIIPKGTTNPINLELYYKKDKDSEKILFDKETIEIVKDGPEGPSGSPGYTMVFDNDFDIIVRDKDGKFKDGSATIPLGIQVYQGVNALTLSSNDITNNFVTDPVNSDAITVVGPTITTNGTKANFTIKVKDPSIQSGSITMIYKNAIKKTFQFNVLSDLVDYDLIVAKTQVNTSDLTSSTSEFINVGIAGADGSRYNITSTTSDLPNFLELWVKQKYNNNTEKEYNITSTNTNTDILKFAKNTQSLEMQLYYISESGTKLLFDSQSITPLKNGDAGASIINEVSQFTAHDSSTTKPENNEWYDNMPPDNYDFDTNHIYIWTRTKTTNSDNAVFYSEPFYDWANGTLGQWCANTNRTEINGGVIATKSIDAKSILVQDLVAFDATIGGWTITSDKLYRYWQANETDTATTLSSGMATTSGKSIAFWAGYHGPGKTPWDDSANWRDNTYFAVTQAGEIVAKKGNLAGWTINSSYISSTQDGVGTLYIASASNAGDNWIRAEDASGTDTFKISKEGKITANAGIMGGWTITSKYINTEKLDSKGNGNRFRLNSALTSDSTTTWIRASTLSNNGATDATTFCVYKDGRMKATNVEITGKIQTGSKIEDGVGMGNNEYSRIYDYNVSVDAYGTRWEHDNGNMFVLNSGSIILKAPKFYMWDSTKTAAGWLEIGEGILEYHKEATNGNGHLCLDSSTYVDLKVQGDKKLWCRSTGGRLKGTWELDNSVAVTSDINAKHTINFLDDNYTIFFDNLQPVTYKYNNGTSDRRHTGFIAQEVNQALDKAEISTQNFAGLVIEEPGTENELWALRYEEFIALNTWQIQKLKTRVAQLEQEIKELKNEI